MITAREFIPRKIHIHPNHNRFQGRQWISNWLQSKKITNLSANLTRSEASHLLLKSQNSKNSNTKKITKVDFKTFPENIQKSIHKFLLGVLNYQLELDEFSDPDKILQRKHQKHSWILEWNLEKNKIDIYQNQEKNTLDDDLVWVTSKNSEQTTLRDRDFEHYVSNDFRNGFRNYDFSMNPNTELFALLKKHILQESKKPNSPKGKTSKIPKISVKEGCYDLNQKQIAIYPIDRYYIRDKAKPIHRTLIKPSDSALEKKIFKMIQEDPSILSHQKDEVEYYSCFSGVKNEILGIGVPSIRKKRKFRHINHWSPRIEYETSTAEEVLTNYRSLFKQDSLIEESKKILRIASSWKAYLIQELKKEVQNTESKEEKFSPEHLESLDKIQEYLDPTIPLAWNRGKAIHFVWNQFAPNIRSLNFSHYLDRDSNPHHSLHAQTEPRKNSKDPNQTPFTLPPILSRRYAGMILKRISEYDYPVNPEVFQKVLEKPETQKILNKKNQ